jgi:hypothetical protein
MVVGHDRVLFAFLCAVSGLYQRHSEDKCLCLPEAQFAIFYFWIVLILDYFIVV